MPRRLDLWRVGVLPLFCLFLASPSAGSHVVTPLDGSEQDQKAGHDSGKAPAAVTPASSKPQPCAPADCSKGLPLLYTDSDHLKPNATFFQDLLVLVDSTSCDKSEDVAAWQVDLLKCARSQTEDAISFLLVGKGPSDKDRKNAVAAYRSLHHQVDQEISKRSLLPRLYTDTDNLKPNASYVDDLVAVLDSQSYATAREASKRRLEWLNYARKQVVDAIASVSAKKPASGKAANGSKANQTGQKATEQDPKSTTPPADDGSKQNASGDDRKNALATYRNLLTQLDQEINKQDPLALHLDFYAGTQFSNLYREKPDDSYFAKSRSFLFLEIRQALRNDLLLDTYGIVSLQTNSKITDTSDLKGVVAATGGFGAEAGFVWWGPGTYLKTDRLGIGLIAGVGTLAFTDTDTNPASSSTDKFHRTDRVGVIVRQNTGLWEGTFSEFAYYHDPRFPQHPDRLIAKGRVVLSPRLAGSVGKGLGAYLEGVVNEGKGQDEARVTIGIRFDALAVLRAIIGQPDAATPSSGKN